MTLIFNEEFAINPQSAQSGGGGGTKNNVDWSKIGFNLYSYNTSSHQTDIINGKVWRNGEGFFPRATADEIYSTKFVNFSQPFEINVKFSAPTGDTSSNSVIFGNNYTNQYFRTPASEFMYANGDTIIWAGLSTNGSSWDAVNITFTTSEISRVAGDIYECNYKYDGSKYTVTVKHNDEVATKSVDVTGTPYYSNNDSSYSGSYFCFGMNANNSSTAFHGGYFYLDNTYIKQNDVLVWGCEEGQNYIEVDPNNYLISNVTKVGAVEDNKGVLSGFTSSSNYAYMLQVGSLSEGSEVNIGFIMPTSLSSDVPVIAGKNNSSWTGDIFLDDSTSKFSSWDNSTVWSGQTTLIGNHEYSFKLVKNSSGKLDAYLKEGNPTSNINDYTLEFSGAVDFLSGNQLYLGRWDYQYFNDGSINLNNCYIKIDGQTTWQGVVPQGTRV